MTTTYKDIAVQAAKDKDHLPIRATGGAIAEIIFVSSSLAIALLVLITI